MTKFVYSFAEGNKDMRDLLGGKGANLAEMTSLGLPVPRGFTITTQACESFYENGKKLSDEIQEQIYSALKALEELTGKTLGDPQNPLLVSVRSGAPVSMPGMMDTVLNLGLNDEVVEGLAKATNNRRFAFDSYRRFIQMFSDVVKGLARDEFEGFLDTYKEENNIASDIDLTESDLENIIKHYKEAYKNITGEEFPQDPRVQLMAAALAVFASWNNDRAIAYRRLNEITGISGTAVNVQEMVYGNRGETSGTGVAFTRNPATGEKKLFGEYLMNAQGEDVVAGIRTPNPISHLEEQMPDVYKQFVDVCNTLEDHYRDMQDMEFTIEEGKLFMLQTRNGKRTTSSALKIAVDLVDEGMITEDEALLRVEAKDLDQLLHPVFDADSEKAAKVITHGLPASPGAATGKIYFEASDVQVAAANGEKDILLVRLETSPEDIEGMNIANGILTARGGMTSHAAVVARGMGKCCISGCQDIKVDEASKTLTTADGHVYHEGDWLSLNGTTGDVYDGRVETKEPEIGGDFARFMSWADARRRLQILTNADTPRDAKVAVGFGAEGIGLCRTEHMFFDEKRIFAMRQMILADSVEAREKALAKLLPLQQGDFEELYRVLDGKKVIIRYLDPPLHEFLPKEENELRDLAEALGKTYEEVVARATELHEVNPMMGHRGLRLAITYPEIAVMQTRAVIQAAIAVRKEGIDVTPHIMIPLSTGKNDLQFVKKIVVDTVEKIFAETGEKFDYEVGTMVETPRAALMSHELAEVADFYSFGTNDLTQLTFGFSRDDAGKFLGAYYERNIFENDPFARLDQEGVGQLIAKAVKDGREVKPGMSIGICGEHGGDPSSIDFCHRAGLSYVSCSPFRVPIARLAAAQAAVRNK